MKIRLLYARGTRGKMILSTYKIFKLFTNQEHERCLEMVHEGNFYLLVTMESFATLLILQQTLHFSRVQMTLEQGFGSRKKFAELLY
jgi:hypothetical protein